MLPIIRVEKKPNTQQVIDFINEIGGIWEICEAHPEASQGVLAEGESWVGIDYFPDEEYEPGPLFELRIYGPNPRPLAEKFAAAAIEKWGGTAENLKLTA